MGKTYKELEEELEIIRNNLKVMSIVAFVSVIANIFLILAVMR